MTIITRNRSDNYAVVPNAVTADSRLSFEARGVLCYLLAKPNNWQVQIADIQNQGGFGRDKAYRILKELREVGYLSLEIKRNEKAQIISQDYVVYDVADVSKKPLPENTEIATNTKLLPEKPDTAEPDTAEPDTANTDGIISKEDIINTYSFSDTNVSSKQRARASDKAIEDEFHETFWPSYPNKVGKPKALTSFIKARKLDTLEAIMSGLKSYIENKPPDRQWLNPTTFLNQERWNDQPATISEQNNANSSHQTRKQSLREQFVDSFLELGSTLDARQFGGTTIHDISDHVQVGSRINGKREVESLIDHYPSEKLNN